MEFLKILLLMGFIWPSEINVEEIVPIVKIEENAWETYAENLIEYDEYVKVKSAKSSNYIGVYYDNGRSRWVARRYSKKQKKDAYNGWSHKNERIAAQASDTLARKLMRDGEEKHELNFPYEHTEVNPEAKSSKYIGVYKRCSRWVVTRQSKKYGKILNGCYKDETRAAQASDTLARKLMKDGDTEYKLNFPYENIEVYPEAKSSNYIGVCYTKDCSRWVAYRRSKKQKKQLFYGSYRDEKEAALASDTLARELMTDGEEGHNLNFNNEEYYTVHWEKEHQNIENEGIYSKRKRNNSDKQQEYFVYKME